MRIIQRLRKAVDPRRPRRIVTLTFSDDVPWTETYGPFRSLPAAERFVRDVEAKGYGILWTHHLWLERPRKFKAVK